MGGTTTPPRPVGGRPPLRAGLATSIGSLPHTDAAAAVRAVLSAHRALPAAPQLPARSPAEGMLAQAAVGIAGVTVGADGSLRVDPSALDPDAPVAAGVDGEAYGGLRAFLGAVSGRRDGLKLQLTGPVTLGLALLRAGAPRRVAFAVAGRAVAAHARALLDATTAAAPAAPLVVFLDEPGLVAARRADFPLAPDDAVDLLSGALAVLEPHATTGVHCCGPTDWRLATQAGPAVLSMPADGTAVDAAGAIGTFVEDGGWVAWGAVPTTGPVGGDADPLWRRLADLWSDLVRAGCDPVLLRTRALVTPACGVAGHGVSQAERVLRLAAELADRARDQAVGARLSAGA